MVNLCVPYKSTKKTIISLYSVNQLLFVMGSDYSLRRTTWIFKYTLNQIRASVIFLGPGAKSIVHRQMPLYNSSPHAAFPLLTKPFKAYWLRDAPTVWHSTTVRSVHTMFMCFVFIREQTATCATYSINWLVFITEIKSVYCAVRTGPLNKTFCTSSLKG